MGRRLKPSEEWLKQADYDFETAEAMFRTGRYIYAVFMVHLAIEKVLKGLYTEVQQEIPPRVHNLVYLAKKSSVVPPEKIRNFLEYLNTINVPLRYPESLEKTLREFTKEKVREILEMGKESLKWLKGKLEK